MMMMPMSMEELAAAFAASVTIDSTAVVPHKPPNTGGGHSNLYEPGIGEEACLMRLRFPDGRVLCKSFGAGRPAAAALLGYCGSVLAELGAVGRTFRLVRVAGGATSEVDASSGGGGSAEYSFRDLGLHRCTVHVILC